MEKILQYHYTLCLVYLFSREPLCSNVVFGVFFFFCFVLLFFFSIVGLILSPKKMAMELSLGSSARVLKLDGCTDKSVSASCLCLLILSWHTVRCAAVPPLENSDSFKVGPSRHDTEEAPVDGK